MVLAPFLAVLEAARFAGVDLVDEAEVRRVAALRAAGFLAAAGLAALFLTGAFFAEVFAVAGFFADAFFTAVRLGAAFLAAGFAVDFFASAIVFPVFVLCFGSRSRLSFVFL
jgi:hypothetical protein